MILRDRTQKGKETYIDAFSQNFDTSEGKKATPPKSEGSTKPRYEKLNHSLSSASHSQKGGKLQNCPKVSAVDQQDNPYKMKTSLKVLSHNTDGQTFYNWLIQHKLEELLDLRDKDPDLFDYLCHQNNAFFSYLMDYVQYLESGSGKPIMRNLCIQNIELPFKTVAERVG